MRSHQPHKELDIMSAQAISTASLICMGRSRRAAMMRAMSHATDTRHATGFQNGMHIARPAVPEHSLAKGDLQRLPARDLSIRCISGQIWLTRHGDSEDHILGPGQVLAVGRDQQTVIEALRESRFCLDPA
jgi:hypothetical protein